MTRSLLVSTGRGTCRAFVLSAPVVPYNRLSCYNVRMADKIRFTCEVVEVRVMKADSTVRVTLDLPETAIPQMALLAECKRQGWALKTTMIPDDVSELADADT